MGGCITREFLREQMTRFGKLRGYPVGDQPEDKAARKDMLDALAQVCPDEETATRVVDLLLRTSRFFPAIADVYDAGKIVRESHVPEWKPNPVSDCPDCGGSGWKSVPSGKEGYEVAEHCDHARLREIQMAEAIR